MLISKPAAFLTFITGFLALNLLVACESKSNDNPKQPEPPLQEIEVWTYEDSGTRLRAIAKDGRVVIEGVLLDKDSQIFYSKGFVAYTKYDKGLRLKTVNFKGEELPTSFYILNEKSKVVVSDNIIALSADDNGQRLYSFDKGGKPLNTSFEILDDETEIYISANIIAYTAQLLGKGEQIGENTYHTKTLGCRLFSVTKDNKILGSSFYLLDNESDVSLTDDSISLSVETFKSGQKIDGNTYAAERTGRKRITFTLDGGETAN